MKAPLPILVLLSPLAPLAASCTAGFPIAGAPRVVTHEASLGRPESVGSVHEPASAPTSWKERMAVPYVFVERVGDYRELGATMRGFLAQIEREGIQATGAPFALFFDDPGRVSSAELRARVCLPVSEVPGNSNLHFEILPRAMVAYSRVAGPYPKVPAMYPALLKYMQGLGWEPAGPIREVYLVNPYQATSYEDLLTEVQIPWSAGR